MKRLQNLNRAAVARLAKSLAKKYASKDVVIGLTGQLGAGKTAFVKDFAKSLGIKKVSSPTFVISHTHPLSKKVLHHFDLYRLENKKQLVPIGIDEIFSGKNRIVLIEWVDKFPELAKKCDLIINFEIAGKNLRHVTIH